MQRKLLVSLCFSLLPLVLFFFATPARAGTTITVNSTLDVIANDGKCTLREAVIAANTNSASGGVPGECPAGSGADTIIVPAGTYTLTITGLGEDGSLTGDLDITQTVTISGAGPSTIIKQQGTFDRIFEIFGPAHVMLDGMQIQLGNDTSGFGGGAIRNRGMLILKNTLIIANQSDSEGAGLKNESGASATLDTVSFANNSTVGAAGAILNIGVMTITNSTVSLNTAGSAGGIDNLGIITVTNTTLISNTANVNNGGNFANAPSAQAMLNHVTMVQGSAALRGGAIFNNNAVVTIMNSAIYSNVATGNGGGIWNDSNATLVNVTLSGNQAISATLGQGTGGGIWNGGSITLTHGTITENSASISGGGIFQDVSAISFKMKNTILAYQAFSGGNCSGSPTVISQDYNIDDGFSCGLSGTGDSSSTDPLLGPLADHGGATWTRSLPFSSPAVNRIPLGTNGCGTTITTDQRGYARVAPCDIGAFEYVLRVMLPLIMR